MVGFDQAFQMTIDAGLTFHVENGRLTATPKQAVTKDIFLAVGAHKKKFLKFLEILELAYLNEIDGLLFFPPYTSSAEAGLVNLEQAIGLKSQRMAS